jgi:hypothetical protein
MLDDSVIASTEILARMENNRMRFVSVIVGIVCCAASLASAGMMDVSADRPGEEWCYLGKSTTVIGVPAQPEVTQVTFDGALFTKNAELCFFYDSDHKPLLARGKVFADGWMPIVQYSWKSGDIQYDIEYFAAPLTGENADNTVNFVRGRMHNLSNSIANGTFAAALRHDGGDNRKGGIPFKMDWQYKIDQGAVWRDGKLTYTFSPQDAQIEAVPGTPYTKPFLGQEQFITPRAECCLANYTRELKPGETSEMTFAMPRVPVPATNVAFIKKLTDAKYDDYRQQIIAYWQTQMAGKASFEFPEKRVQDAQRASTVHVMLATRAMKGGWTQTDGLPYPEFYLTSMPEMIGSYLTAGRADWAENVVRLAMTYQKPSGLFWDRNLGHGIEIPASHGHVMYSASLTALYSQDKAFANEIYPALSKSVQYLSNSMDKDPYGLLPPTIAFDAEMIEGHYTGSNTWALLGIRSAVRVARMLGHDDDVTAWTKIAERYQDNILKGIDASVKPDGYVPVGLYPYLTGQAARKGFPFYRTDCDWENMLLAFPNETLSPNDPRVKGTADHIRKEYAEGIMTYRHGQHLHQYITANQAEQYLVMGDDYTALKDVYHILLHCGSTSEGFENLVRPWTDREVDPGCPSPHAWASSKLACLVRDLVLLEYGGKCGMEPGERELWMFNCLSPAWVIPGEKVAFTDAPTEFGTVSASMSFTSDGADVSIHSQFHEMPKVLRLRMPYFKELIAFKTDASQSKQDGDCILLSPDATRVTLTWRDRPERNLHTVENILTDYRSANSFDGVDAKGYAIITPHEPFLLDSEKSDQPQPLSFELVRETFLHEYDRRVQESVKSGGKLVEIQAPPMLTAKEREEAFQHLSTKTPKP